MKWWSRRNDELNEEIAAHMRMAVEERVARGASRADAEAAARREFGNELLVREATRRQWRGFQVERLAVEFALALRGLRRSPRFLTAALLCIAVGTGVTVTIFSALNAILLRPLPYESPNELVVIEVERERRETRYAQFTQKELDAWRSARSLHSVATWRTSDGDLTGDEDLPERVRTAEAEAGLFAVLGMRPQYGRVFDAARDADADVVILSDGLWRRRFGADPSIVGRTIEYNGVAHEVIGIMPAHLAFPEGTQLWELLPEMSIPDDIVFYAGVVGRLRPGVSERAARAEVDVLVQRLKAGGAPASSNYRLVSMRQHLLGALSGPIVIFQAAAVLVLLVACANVAALQLARSAACQREYAVRAAIGAGRAALARHVLVECVTLAMLGGAVGLLLARAGIGLLALAFPDGVPSYLRLTLDGRALLMAVAAALASGLLFGLAPALLAARSRASLALHAAARVTTGRSRLRYALITAEIAITVVLMTGAVVLMRSDVEMRRALGFNPAQVLSFGVPLPYGRYKGEQRSQTYQRLLQRLSSLPGVESVTSSFNAAPLDGPAAAYQPFAFTGEELSQERRASVHFVGSRYAYTLRLDLLDGRDLLPGDATATTPTALVNQAFVAKYLANGSPVDRVITVGQSRPIRIVGVVRDVRHERPPADIPAALYVHDPAALASQIFFLRTNMSDPLTLMPAVRRVIDEIDPALVLAKVQTQERVVRRSFWRERLQRNVVAIFATLTLILAVCGMYGVVSYAVAQRTTEFGVRVALGATPAQLISIVLREAAGIAVTGALIGAAAALVITRAIMSRLHGASSADPLSLAIVIVTLIGVALLAAWTPARRAARLDPVTAIAST